jgi:hypothetical protein
MNTGRTDPMFHPVGYEMPATGGSVIGVGAGVLFFSVVLGVIGMGWIALAGIGAGLLVCLLGFAAIGTGTRSRYGRDY